MLSVSQKKKTTKKEEEPLALFSDLLCAIVRLSQAARKKSFRNVFSASRQNNIGVLLYHCSEIHVHGGKKMKEKKMSGATFSLCNYVGPSKNIKFLLANRKYKQAVTQSLQ